MNTSRTKRRAALGAAGAASAAGIFAALRGRRARRLRSAMEGIEATVRPSGMTGEPAIDLTEPGEGHAPGHRHLPPPPEDREPPSEAHAEHGYRSGHRDRGGRSIAFRTKRGL
jgi:hypothetical protein